MNSSFAVRPVTTRYIAAPVVSLHGNDIVNYETCYFNTKGCAADLKREFEVLLEIPDEELKRMLKGDRPRAPSTKHSGNAFLRRCANVVGGSGA